MTEGSTGTSNSFWGVPISTGSGGWARGEASMVPAGPTDTVQLNVGDRVSVKESVALALVESKVNWGAAATATSR